MSESDKLLAGKIYDPNDPELMQQRHQAHHLSKMYNDLFEEDKKRLQILRELLPLATPDLYLQGPIFFDYGIHTQIGQNFYANTNLVVLDCARIKIGDNNFFGPNITLATPMHPLRYQDRKFKRAKDGHLYGDEYAKAITIEDNCWLASNVVVTGGVTIGAGSVIGANSVVTRDIPANSLAVGNPCRVIRPITKDDDIKLHSELF